MVMRMSESQDNLFSNKPYQVVSFYGESNFWTSTELIKGNQSNFIQEKFIPIIEHKEKSIIDYFNAVDPHSSLFLLHHYKPEYPINNRPILFVHGASHNAEISWCLGKQKETGINNFMKKEGYEFFAITFAHPHGDNHLQAIQINNAILRIQEITKCEKVDLIAHSKGGVPTRIYLTDYGAKYGIPYLGNVHKYIMLGTPNKGNDFVFRHILPNWIALNQKTSSPLAVDSIFYNGRYINTTSRSIYSDSEIFTGQLQMLAKLDHMHPINLRNKTLYHGGRNLYYHSRGIDYAIEEGGFLMDELSNYTLDKDIEVFVLAGTNPFFNYIYLGENDGLSDGLIFVKSVLGVDEMIESGEQLKKRDKINLNHSQLLYNPSSHQWVKNCLDL
jgi:hypothetical protein